MPKKKLAPYNNGKYGPPPIKEHCYECNICGLLLYTITHPKIIGTGEVIYPVVPTDYGECRSMGCFGRYKHVSVSEISS